MKYVINIIIRPTFYGSKCSIRWRLYFGG